MYHYIIVLYRKHKHTTPHRKKHKHTEREGRGRRGTERQKILPMLFWWFAADCYLSFVEINIACCLLLERFLWLAAYCLQVVTYICVVCACTRPYCCTDISSTVVVN